jgi:hypothetical protein
MMMLDYVTTDQGGSISSENYLRARRNTSLTVPQGEVHVSITSHVTVAPSVSPEIAKEFRRHEKKWKRDTRFLSSLSEKYLHPSYARIIGLGRPAIPHILRSLRHEPDDWFYALRAITGSNIVPMSMAGDMKKMTECWLEWGRKRGLV